MECGDCTEHSSELALSAGGEIEISNLGEGGKPTVVVVTSMPVDSLIPRSCWKKKYTIPIWPGNQASQRMGLMTLLHTCNPLPNSNVVCRLAGKFDHCFDSTRYHEALDNMGPPQVESWCLEHET